ncbi:MAG: RNA polymerase factor sigma-54 [Lachnospiraceae bacterium]|nr:RNA polymerase factor sigma-54 [Lachnospiraceae bacterium]
MSLSLELRQKQVLSQRMLQTLNVLQMSTQELESFIEEAALENPVIELSHQHDDSDYSMDENGGKTTEKQLEISRKLEWLESTDFQNRVYYEEDRDSEDPDNYVNRQYSEESLADYLKAQLLFKTYTQLEEGIVEYILNSLDNKGYLVEDADSIAAWFQTDIETVNKIIDDVRALDPAGVCARDLSDCLKIQLERMGSTNELAPQIIENHLPDMAKNHTDSLARKLGCSTAEISEAFDIIRSLNPKPGSYFRCREHLRYITPDIYIIKTESSFEILVNEYRFPAINISVEYKSLLEDTTDKEVKSYLRSKVSEAEALKRNIFQRSETLSKVAKELVIWQKDFFLYGPGHLKPMKLRDLADRVGVHESTISRALNGKYLQCFWGIFPLNYYLVSAIKDDEEISTDSAKTLLRELINHEDKKKPYSDQKLADLLTERGVKISRRTVNKYRVLMEIPDKSGRKIP